MAKLLLIDDDKSLTVSLAEGLTQLGYIVDVAYDTTGAREMLAVSEYELLIVDWNMPGKSGIQLVDELRKEDDYLTKPFALGELVSRVRALLRRPRALEGTEPRSGDLCINTLSRQVSRGGIEIQLTRQEYLLLEFLMRNRNQTFNSEALVERAWSSLSESSPDTVRVHMANLRKKLKCNDQDSPITTIHGQGYVLKGDA